MLYWECKRRLAELAEFRGLVVTYFSNRTITHIRDVREADKAREARTEINLRMNETIRSCLKIGITLSVFYSPPPTRGGFAGELNLLQNMFDLHAFQIPPKRLLDSLDRAIGEYQRLQHKLRRNLFNPFCWIRLGFTSLLGVPFRILGAAGFDGQAIERTVGGKAAKAGIGFVTLIAAVLAILNYLGFSTTRQHLTNLVRHR